LALIDDQSAQSKPSPIAISGAANRAAAEMVNPSPAPAKEPPRRILMLYPFSDTFPSSVRVGNAARRHFSERLPSQVDIFSYYLDLARFPGAEHEERTARFLAQKYADVPPDLVIAAGPAALRFALNRWPERARLLRDAQAAHVMSPTTHLLRTWLGRSMLGLPML
jgi:hypothetical protein